jgi:hypothetical protein
VTCIGKDGYKSSGFCKTCSKYHFKIAADSIGNIIMVTENIFWNELATDNFLLHTS